MSRPMRFQAHETRYRGTLYRSRLEARWAAMFDACDIPYTYEPFDFRGYTPDFLLDGPHRTLVEVRPVATLAEYMDVATSLEWRLGIDNWPHDVLILGTSVLPQFADSGWVGEGDQQCGLLGEAYREAPDAGPAEAWNWRPGLWVDCEKCRAPRFCHTEFSFTRRPCGHYPGGDTSPPHARLHDLWGHAHSATRWVPGGGGPTV